MSPTDLAYPLVGLADSEPGRESWELFWEDEEFSICDRRDLGLRNGMLIVDREGGCWRISSVRDLGLTRGLWRFMLGIREHRVDQTLEEIPGMTFDDAKARLCKAIQGNPDHWRDDEAIAGEDGPLRDEQDLLDE